MLNIMHEINKWTVTTPCIMLHITTAKCEVVWH